MVRGSEMERYRPKSHGIMRVVVLPNLEVRMGEVAEDGDQRQWDGWRM